MKRFARRVWTLLRLTAVWYLSPVGLLYLAVIGVGVGVSLTQQSMVGATVAAALLLAGFIPYKLARERADRLAVNKKVEALRGYVDNRIGSERAGLILSIETARNETRDVIWSERLYWRAALDKVQEALAEFDHLKNALEEVGRAASDLVNLKSTLAEVDERQRELDSRLADQTTNVTRLSRKANTIDDALRTQDDRVVLLLKEARSRLPDSFDVHQLETFSSQLGRRFDALYVEFENRFRGSRELIISRLEQYEHILEPEVLASLGPFVDLGCGRGEWLELMKRRGIKAYGVDVNEKIAEVADQRGLEVRVEDGLEHLLAAPSDAFGLISMFHVAEHLDFETLFDIFRASYRALAPGGVLLVETPSPMNVIVGSSSFYRDPTHKAPLHPQSLEFVASAVGFHNIELRFLNPPSELPFKPPASLEGEADFERMLDHLNSWFLGPQDYALIATKDAPNDE